MLNQKIAFIDLASGHIELKQIPEELIRKFLGGRGLNSYLLYNYVNEKTKPLGPENVIIVGCGLLTGIKGMSFARCAISGKSPESGLLGDANIGGRFGEVLQKTGISHLVIKGKAKKHVYLFIENERISIKDAHDLWGKSVSQTGVILKKNHGEQSESICIGIAGENLVRFAGVFTRRKNTAARCGMGCIMGSKNLKAIVAIGTKQLMPADPEALRQSILELNQKLSEEFLIQKLKEFGSSNLYEIININIGIGRTYNGMTTVFKDNKDINPQTLREKYYTGKAGCQPCSIACQHKYVVKDGPYKGIENDGPEYGVIAHIGPMLGINNLDAVLKINAMLNEYGLDASSTCNILAWMIELYQKGIIDDTLTGSMNLGWSNETQIMELITMIAKRQGFGDFLADGAKEIVQNIGEKAAQYISWIKYLPQSDPVDLRYIFAYALGDAVATRGADHLRSRPIWEAFGLPDEQLRKIYGGPVSSNPQSYEGKGRVIWWWESYVTLFDCLGLCKLLAFHSMPGVFDFGLFAQLIKAATGLDMIAKEVFEVGERINVLERMFLNREGIFRGNDYPSQRYFKPLEIQEDLPQEDKNLFLTMEGFDCMLDEYYQLRGCDSSGIPTEETKKRLGLERLLLDSSPFKL